jgi:anthranilate synthase component I
LVAMTLVSDIHADLITPLGAYLRLAREGGAAFLLESVEKGRLGRYSLVGRGARIVDFAGAERELAAGRPVVGYLAYDHIAQLEPTVPLPDEGAGLPESRFVVADTLVRFDHPASVAEVLTGDRDAVAALLAEERNEPRPGPAAHGDTMRSPSREDYEASVRRAKEYIRDGEAFQIVVSQRAERPTDVSALALYRSLRRINPSPYHFLLDLDGIALVGSSPETLVKLEGTRASLNPIAGTTGPGEGDAEELLASEKDKAEHIMLVDLGRNDLSRVCRPGTVRVGKFLEPERYSHVTHLVSEVAGDLLPETGPFDLLRACFPAGTVSGAPKVRAMQIISELEGYRRGPYAGAVGYALPGGSFDTCIAIRTVVLEGGLARLQAGAGIVADSDPAAEHEECLRKLAALEAALEEAEASSASSAPAGKGDKRAARRTAQPSADKRRERRIPPPAGAGDGGAGLRPAEPIAGEEGE